MRIAHIVPRITEEASGTFYVVPALCRTQRALGHDAELHTLAASENAPSWIITHDEGPRVASRLGPSASLRNACINMVDSFDIIHVHGLWMLPNVYPFLPRASRARRVLSPHGTVMPWAMDYHSWRKRAFWIAAQSRARRADAVHATSEAEAAAARSMGFSEPVFVIPNGIDVPAKPPVIDTAHRRTVLYIGRVHPKKGLDLLLQAWSAIEVDRPDWDLLIAGPSEVGTEDELRRLAANLGIQRVRFHGPVYGSEKVEAYAAAEVHVLPTRSENFGVTVLEALALGTPVITTQGAPWAQLEDQRCGWWIEPSVSGIRNALDQATKMSHQDLATMGDRGRQWAASAFSWQSIAERMVQRYEALLH